MIWAHHDLGSQRIWLIVRPEFGGCFFLFSCSYCASAVINLMNTLFHFQQRRSLFSKLLLAASCMGLGPATCFLQPAAAQTGPDFLRELQFQAVEQGQADWGHWGYDPGKYTGWTNHSNRLVPIYTFGIDLQGFGGSASPYRDPEKLQQIYGRKPLNTLNPNAEYLDQTDIYRLQKRAREQGKKYIFLIIFDGMDWQTTWAAATYRTGQVAYRSGRGSGLSFQDYDKTVTDFGTVVTAPHNNGTATDVNAQMVRGKDSQRYGGYDASLGGDTPWAAAIDLRYLVGMQNSVPHPYVDSAASATAISTGVRTYNAAINTDPTGGSLHPLPRGLQAEGLSIGLVTSVPISHATPASCYANNVSRNDYQDITRDLLGLPSIANRQPLPGVDVLIGTGWAPADEEMDDEQLAEEIERQGNNFSAGNKYLDTSELDQIDVDAEGNYVVSMRTPGESGRQRLGAAAARAARENHRLFGFYGTRYDHLPYQTADGQFNPTRGASRVEVYQPEDVRENPTLADMTSAALQVLETNEQGFWLLIEPGDVDWANHNDNLDDSIGAVFSGEAAFDVVTKWVEARDAWDDTCVILTADHGHLFVLTDPTVLTEAAATGESKPTTDDSHGSDDTDDSHEGDDDSGQSERQDPDPVGDLKRGDG